MNQKSDPTLAALARRGFRFKKELGQHFLLNRFVLEQITDCAGITAGDIVVEAGAGAGSLTEVLAAAGATVVAVELDRSLIPFLRERFLDEPRVRVVHGDIMRLDPDALAAEVARSAAATSVVTAKANLTANYATSATALQVAGLQTTDAQAVSVVKPPVTDSKASGPQVVGPQAIGSRASDSQVVGQQTASAPYKICANLPYHISSPFVNRAFRQLVGLDAGAILLQHEVADKLTASPGEEYYGIPALTAVWFGEVRQVMTLGPAYFYPPPQVDSTVVAFRRKPKTFGVEEKALWLVIRGLFNQRRKNLLNGFKSLGALTPRTGESWAAALEAAGIDFRRRPETLSLDEFAAILRAAGYVQGG